MGRLCHKKKQDNLKGIRKHHNNKGTRQIKNGNTVKTLKNIARKLGIKYEDTPCQK